MSKRGTNRHERRGKHFAAWRDHSISAARDGQQGISSVSISVARAGEHGGGGASSAAEHVRTLSGICLDAALYYAIVDDIATAHAECEALAQNTFRVVDQLFARRAAGR